MIQTLKELEKFFKLCQKQGVKKADLTSFTFEFGDLPSAQTSLPTGEEANPVDPYSNFPEGELSPEQLMFYSAGGLPEDDPFLKDH